MSLNEADTRAQLIHPKLNIAGWTRSQVRFPSLPSDTWQERIVEHLDAIKNEIVEMHKTQAQDAALLGQMEQAILAQAFRGEL